MLCTHLLGHAVNKHVASNVSTLAAVLYTMMSDVCCRECLAWCKSFTKTEVLLCVLQATVSVLFLTFLTFLILHLVVCSRNRHNYKVIEVIKTKSNVYNADNNDIGVNNTDVELQTDTVTTEGISIEYETDPTDNSTLQSLVTARVTAAPNSTNTVDKTIKCTWNPSHKTKPSTHFYEHNKVITKSNKFIVNRDELLQSSPLFEDIEVPPDGQEIFDARKDLLVALVKIDTPINITFGCTLTVVSAYWSLTAASCIEAIEEVHSLDSYVMQAFRDGEQSTHTVAGVAVHPLYRGAKMAFDLAALKSENSLVKSPTLVATLPSVIDYLLITIAEAFTMLGFGNLRNTDRDPLKRSVRQVFVHSLPLSQCAGGPSTWSPRHLAGGTPAGHGAVRTSPICAGVLRSRTSPCNYCSGTPLMKKDVLLGIMSDHNHCGQSCEPALFVNLALVGDWLRSVLTE